MKGEFDMTQYLLAVHMVEGEPVPDEAQMQQAYKAVDADEGGRRRCRSLFPVSIRSCGFPVAARNVGFPVAT